MQFCLCSLVVHSFFLPLKILSVPFTVTVILIQVFENKQRHIIDLTLASKIIESLVLPELFSEIFLTVYLQVEGVSEFVRGAFSLLLDLYEMDCEHFDDTKKTLYFTLLERVIKLPWEAKAKYHRLCALLPYLGIDRVCIIMGYYSLNNVIM